MRNGTGSQWRTSRRSGVTWSYFLLAVVAVNPRSDKSGDSRLRSRKSQQLDAAPDEKELTKTTADRPRRLMDRSDSSRTPRLRTEVEGRIKAPKTFSSALSRWTHRLRVAHHRKSVFSGLSHSRLERIHLAIRSIPSSIRRRCCATVDGGPHV